VLKIRGGGSQIFAKILKGGQCIFGKKIPGGALLFRFILHFLLTSGGILCHTPPPPLPRKCFLAEKCAYKTLATLATEY
jgi:hypothetical protein